MSRYEDFRQQTAARTATSADATEKHDTHMVDVLDEEPSSDEQHRTTGGTLFTAEAQLDSTDEELERLVFGDSSGFATKLRERNKDGTRYGGEVAVAAEDDVGGNEMDALPDDDLFFFDAGTTSSSVLAVISHSADNEEDTDWEEGSRTPPAWHDSDDDRVVVSLESAPRLRRLRKFDGEDFISGREYIRRLREQFEILHPRPNWATQAATEARKRGYKLEIGKIANSDEDSGQSDVDGDQEIASRPLAKLLRNIDALTASPASRRRRFRPDVVDVQPMAKIESSANAAIESIQIHPTLPFLLASGTNSTAHIYRLTSPQEQADPNPLLTSLHIKHNPLYSSSFSPTTSDVRVFLSGRRRHFHVWDLASGKVERVSRIIGHAASQQSMERFKISPNGRYMALQGTPEKRGGAVVNILDAHTLQWTAQAPVESLGGIADMAWWADSAGLVIAGKNGEVTEWSLQVGRAIARWRDEGAVGTTVIALGGRSSTTQTMGGDRWVAVGSAAGIVNVYDRATWTCGDEIPASPIPVRAIDNLLHPISALAFSPFSMKGDEDQGTILAIASRFKAGALRLVHLPTCTVYPNWPTATTRLGRATSLAFGNTVDGDGVLLVVGMEGGRIGGWQIRGR